MSEEALRALTWIDQNDHTRARWLVNGKPPRGRDKPITWTHIEFSGENAMIRIPTPVWDEMRHLIEAADLTSKRIYRLTAEGRTALRAGRDTQAGQNGTQLYQAKPQKDAQP